MEDSNSIFTGILSGGYVSTKRLNDVYPLIEETKIDTEESFPGFVVVETKTSVGQKGPLGRGKEVKGGP